MTFQYVFKLASYTSHRAKHKTGTQQTRYRKGYEVKELNIKSVHERAVEVRPRSSPVQLSGPTAYSSHGEALSCSEIKQAEALMAVAFLMWKNLENLTGCCKSLPFVKEFNRSWASSGSGDYQLLALPGSLGLAGYRF